MLHGPEEPDAVFHRGIAEVEAESVALMVASAHGLSTEDYTIPYVSTWAASVPDKTPVEVVQATAERVRTAAVSILDGLDTTQVANGTPPGLDAVAPQQRRTSPELRPPAATRSVEVLGLGRGTGH